MEAKVDDAPMIANEEAAKQWDEVEIWTALDKAVRDCHATNAKNAPVLTIIRFGEKYLESNNEAMKLFRSMEKEHWKKWDMTRSAKAHILLYDDFSFPQLGRDKKPFAIPPRYVSLLSFPTYVS